MSYRGRSVFFVIINRFITSLKPRNLKTNTKHIGSDYLGNNYFEVNIPKEMFDSRKQPKRWFKPPHEDLWDRPLPAEWNAWLRMTRKEPPTEEEIQYNLMVEKKKKEFSEKTKPQQIGTKTNPFSSYPSFPEYDESHGFEDKKK